MEESLRERQENELHVLQSIYLDDFILQQAEVESKENKSASKEEDDESEPAEPRREISDLLPDELIQFRLHLTPQLGMVDSADIHATVDMQVTLPAEYPRCGPKVLLINSRGVPRHDLSDIERELAELVVSSLGEEMMYTLAQHVQKRLVGYNTPQLSFYEQMVVSQQTKQRREEEERERQMKEKREAEQRRSEYERQQIQVTLDRRNEDLRMLRQRGENLQVSPERPRTPRTARSVSINTVVRKVVFEPGTATPPRLRSRSPSPSPGAPSEQLLRSAIRRSSAQQALQGSPRIPLSSVATAGQSTKEVTTGDDGVRSATVGNFDITLGKCVGCNTHLACTLHVALSQHGELCTLSRWNLLCRSPKKQETGVFPPGLARRLKQVVSIEAEFASLQTLSHANIVHYLSMRHWLEHDTIHVEVLEQFIHGGSLSDYLRDRPHNIFQAELLHSCCRQLVEAIAYLHSNNFVHKDIQFSSIFLDQRGNIRLAGYGIMKRLTDLRRAMSLAGEEMAPYERYGVGKKGDIYRVGLIALNLSQGKESFERPDVLPSTLTPTFKDFIEQCLHEDEKLRASARELLVHAYISTSTPASESYVPARAGFPSPPSLSSPGVFNDSIARFGHRSRLLAEFELERQLGKGAFGDVLKVRNKLDGCSYAIKRIPLEDSTTEVNSKIIREVKLLSRLNHENVVRYYNSWIECPDADEVPCELLGDDDGFDDDEVGDSEEENLRGAMMIPEDSYEWSPHNSPKTGNSPMSHHSPKARASAVINTPRRSRRSLPPSGPKLFQVPSDSSADDDEASTDDDDDDDYDEEESFSEDSNRCYSAGDLDDMIQFHEMVEFEGRPGPTEAGVFDMDDSDDGGIQFKTSPSPSDDEKKADKKAKEAVEVNVEEALDEGPEKPTMQFLYIQMEFCEQSSLRDVIDKQSLYQDENRVWRLFRELVEGIAHIHSQHMIHRDLKPLNIFLDINDHIKIGDFGLATTRSHSLRQNSFMAIHSDRNSPVLEDWSRSASSSQSSRVGTALYISPELKGLPKYSQKVDIYSLGIIFFEMCNPPLTTGMERIKVLSGLRSELITFPKNFDVPSMEKQIKLIRWMLKHDPALRPTARELLDHDCLPLAMEEREMKEVLRRAVSSTNSTRYHDLMSALFSQRVDSVVDFTYDMDLHKGSIGTATLALYQTHVVDRLVKVFRHHGAVVIDPPQLTPYAGMVQSADSTVCLMDRYGGLVAMQHDLLTSFARLVSRNGVQHLKRYVIGKVYRDKKVRGAHPKEIYQCAFDIVTPSAGTLWPDAEVIFAVSEIVQEFEHLQRAGYEIRLNHASLAQAFLRHCSIPLDQHTAVYGLLHELGLNRKEWGSVEARLAQLSISELAVQMLEQMSYPLEPDKAAEFLEPLKRVKGNNATMVEEGLSDLNKVISHLNALGTKLPIYIDMSVTHNAHVYYSGVVFRLQPMGTLRRGKRSHVLAMGGRYDKLLTNFAPPLEKGAQPLPMSAVGACIAMDTIISGMGQHEKDQSPPCLCEVLITYLGSEPMLQERISIVRDLWAAGVHADFYHKDPPSSEEVQAYCKANRIPHLIMLKDRNLVEKRAVKVRTFVRTMSGDKATPAVDKMVPLSELVEYLLSKRENYESPYSSRMAQYNPGADAASSTSSNTPSGGVPPVSVTVMPAESGKLPAYIKRKYQTQALIKVTPLAHKLGIRPPMELLALELSKTVLQEIRSAMDLSVDEDEFAEQVAQLRSQLPKHRKYLNRIFDNIQGLVYVKKVTVIFLYSCKDEYCEVIF